MLSTVIFLPWVRGFCWGRLLRMLWRTYDKYLLSLFKVGVCFLVELNIIGLAWVWNSEIYIANIGVMKMPVTILLLSWKYAFRYSFFFSLYICKLQFLQWSLIMVVINSHMESWIQATSGNSHTPWHFSSVLLQLGALWSLIG